MRFSFVAIACFLAFVAVAFGAFGAHALESRVSLARVETWTVAVHYHSLHALAMIAGIATSGGLLIAGDACFIWQLDSEMCDAKPYMVSRRPRERGGESF